MAKLQGFFLCTLAIGGITLGAVAKPGSEMKDSALDGFLQKPLEIRLIELRASKDLQQITERMIFDEKYHIQQRWQALRSLVAFKDERAKSLIQKSLSSKEWFLRDAALRNAALYYPKSSLKFAKQLLQDPSLLVRTTAVKILHRFQDKESRDLLWQELHSEQNFRKGQSLWIRKHIVKALEDIEPQERVSSQEELSRYFQLLEDSDPRVQDFALKKLALRAPKVQAIGNKAKESQLQFWRDYAKENNLLIDEL